MKIITTAILLLFLFNSCTTTKSHSSQLDNSTECVRENWLTVYKGSDTILFSSPSDKIDVYTEIKQLLLSGEIRLWYERTNNPVWLTSPLPSMIHDSIQYSGDSLYYNPYFDYVSQGDSPLKSTDGKDSVYTYPDGSMSYIYPTIKYEPVTFDKVSEIRIKEILVHDTINNTDFLKPSLIAFDIYTIHHNVLFWVKVDDLFDKITINRRWINHIVDKKYSGFVYKRNSCNDPDYQWRKVYH